MIRGHDDNGVIFKAAFLQRLQKARDLVVDIADRAVIGAPSVADRVIIQLDVRGAIAVTQAFAVGIAGLGRRESQQINLLVGIKIPFALATQIGIVWLDQRYR